ncbi:adenosylcobinamide-GDP ribazoletransferase [Kribbella sp. NBC_01245]|uniref:adenosylcobinamide-GDP ribazoletransferase n=1 Tax=Kribbella sp. NBC_01245 TaxID=2903578 RepID=UPI002E2DEB11|nr:adenosylcobinamide-GDP ribazoletransferase [Kribbella sp. NBC_01245]
MGDGVRLAFGTLSVLPAGVPGQVDRKVAGRAMILAPLVGLVIGGIAAGVVAGVSQLRPDAPLLAAVLGVVVLIALSGALHLDGLADMADGLGSRRDRETMLAIMKKGDVGPFGVATIIAVLLIDVAALTACVSAGLGWQAILVAAVASRLTLPWACRTGVPSARPDGLGAMVAATVRPLYAALATLAVLVAAVGLVVISAPTLSYEQKLSEPEALGLVAGGGVLVAVGAGLLVVRRARRAFGGITGDVLGAGVEAGFAVCLIVIALSL